ncbi:hypothetical protein DNK10_15195 [Pseudomonas daroniae]|nr:hypothetical protein DNK10_15195 [Pseudomonas daroniae]
MDYGLQLIVFLAKNNILLPYKECGEIMEYITMDCIQISSFQKSQSLPLLRQLTHVDCCISIIQKLKSRFTS